VCGFDNAQSGSTTNQVGSIYLGAGEHQVVILAANTVTTTRADYFDISVEYRGPDGVTRVLDSSTFYTQVNHAPTLTSTGGQTLTAITEDAIGNNGDAVANIVGSTIGDVDPRAVAGIALTALASGRGTWQYFLDGGTTWANVGSVSDTAALLLRPADRLRFVPDTRNADTATISYCAWDQTSGLVGTKVDRTANGGTTAFSTSGDTAAITVLAVNDAPDSGDAATTIVEDATYTFALTDFAFSDPIDDPDDALAGVKITTTPVGGSVRLDGTALNAGEFITVAAIAAGRVTYVPTANATGSPYTTFPFQVQDDGGTASGGVDLDPTPKTITVSVTAVNDPPTGTDLTKSVIEDLSCFITASDFGFTDPADRPSNGLYRVLITTLPAHGSLTLSGAAVAAGQYVTVTDLSLHRLKFSPAANAVGAPYTSFTFQVQDDGGTSGGGVDLDPAPNTLTFNITAVNDEPAGSDATLAAIEDQAHVISVADFGFTDPSDDPPNALLAVRITTLPDAGTLLLSGAAVAVGQSVSVNDLNLQRFTFTAAANANGSPYTSFTFQVRDNGGTENSGVELDATPNTLTFHVAAANDPPVVGALAATPDPLTAGQTLTLTATDVNDALDAGGMVVRVDFYCESNALAGLQTGSGGDTLLGSDTDSADGWSIGVATTGWSPGSYTYYAQAIDNEGGASSEGTAAATTSNTLAPIYNLDTDGNGAADALTDGILILRYLFDPTGSWSYADALGSGATRTTREEIRTFLALYTPTEGVSAAGVASLAATAGEEDVVPVAPVAARVVPASQQETVTASVPAEATFLVQAVAAVDAVVPASESLTAAVTEESAATQLVESSLIKAPLSATLLAKVAPALPAEDDATEQVFAAMERVATSQTFALDRPEAAPGKEVEVPAGLSPTLRRGAAVAFARARDAALAAQDLFDSAGGLLGPKGYDSRSMRGERLLVTGRLSHSAAVSSLRFS